MMTGPRTLATRRGELALPAFLPDATRAVVRAVDSADLEATGVRALMVNTLHIASRPGLSVIKTAGGLHAFMGWPGPIATDSGGFQVYSLLAAGLATVSRQGFSYRAARGAERERLTPETCIARQLRAGSDLLFCLDHCTGPDAEAAELRESVENTVAWSRACRRAFDGAVSGASGRPLLYAVIQGGSDIALRRECAERLVEIGFDGFGFGGWPLEGRRLSPMVAATAAILEGRFPLHGLGIGKPENVVAAFRAGYSTFDCVIPTRDARHGRLFVFAGPPSPSMLGESGFYTPLSLESPRLRRDNGPVEEGCDCPCCTRYSRAYLHHLYAVKDAAAARLATLHNLRFYSRLVEALARE
jgi:queuine tRNA-ribosyltransferase